VALLDELVKKFGAAVVPVEVIENNRRVEENAFIACGCGIVPS
jgi:hypothetical protein